VCLAGLFAKVKDDGDSATRGEKMRLKDRKVRYLIGLIRVMTFEDQKSLDVQGKLIEAMFPDLQVLSRCIPDQHEGIHDEKTQEKAEPKIIDLARKFMQEDLNALIISCAADPALDVLRKELPFPIVGAGSAAAHCSLCVGSRIGVLGIGTKVPEKIQKILGEKCVAYRKIPQIQNASEISPGVLQGALEKCGDLVDLEADVILLACAGLAAVGLAQLIYEQFGVISVDPVHAAGSVVRQILSVTRKGIL